MKLLSLFILLFSLSTASLLANDWDKQNSIPNGAKNVKMLIPIYSQKVKFNLPNQWKPVFEKAYPTSYIFEMIPQNETLDKWTEMLTVQGLKGMASTISLEQSLIFIANLHKKSCKDKVIFKLLEKDKISGFDAQHAIIGCGNSQENIGEIAYFIAVKGKDDIYMFHKAMRGNAFPYTNPPLTKENSKSFISDFLPIRLCKKEGKTPECL